MDLGFFLSFLLVAAKHNSNLYTYSMSGTWGFFLPSSTLCDCVLDFSVQFCPTQLIKAPTSPMEVRVKQAVHAKGSLLILSHWKLSESVSCHYYSKHLFLKYFENCVRLVDGKRKRNKKISDGTAIGKKTWRLEMWIRKHHEPGTATKPDLKGPGRKWGSRTVEPREIFALWAYQTVLQNCKISKRGHTHMIKGLMGMGS